MDEYANIYYVDNARNADHRTGVFPTGMFGTSVPRPVPPPQGAVVPARTVWMQPPQPTYVQPMQYAPPVQTSPLGSLFGNMHAGQLIELVAELYAAFRTLPAAPVTTRDAGTDIANSITYDQALAQHAKTDEQVRTIGHLVARLVR